MQDGEQVDRYWWRAGGSPVAPVRLTAEPPPWSRADRRQRLPDLALATRPLAPALIIAPRRGMRQAVSALCLAAAGIAALLGLSNARAGLAALPFDADGALVHLGLALEQVAVSGHRQTPDGDIFDALQLGDVQSLPMFDGRAAQGRLERLPWVAQAHVMRVLPGGLDVTIVERVPAALWRVPGSGRAHYVLVDRTGRNLATAAADAAPGLLALHGEGADTAFAELLQLEPFERLRPQLRGAERIGGRRWTLHLHGGMKVHLPSGGEAGAMTQLQSLLQSKLDPKVTEVDLRLPGRMAVRFGEGRGVSSGADRVDTADAEATAIVSPSRSTR